MTEIVKAIEHLMEFMKAQVKERKAVIGSTAPSEQYAGTTQIDAFTMPVKANEDDDRVDTTDHPSTILFLFWTLLSLRCRLAMS